MKDCTTTDHCDMLTLTMEDLLAIKQEMQRRSTRIQTPFGEILIFHSNACLQNEIRLVKHVQEVDPIVRD